MRAEYTYHLDIRRREGNGQVKRANIILGKQGADARVVELLRDRKQKSAYAADDPFLNSQQPRVENA